MEAEFAEIDELLIKLEADASNARGDARRVIESEIAELRKKRQEIAAGGDIVLASREGNDLERDTEEAVQEIEDDIP